MEVLPQELQKIIMFYTLEHPCARMIKSHILSMFLQYQYHYDYDEYHDIVQNNNLDIHLLKTLFFHRMEKEHERELKMYELDDDYEGMYRCNINYCQIKIEKRLELRNYENKIKLCFEHYDEFINKQFYCRIFINRHFYIFGIQEYKDIKADEYNYLVNQYIERHIINSNRIRNRSYESDDDYDDESDDDDDDY